jgi:hypothetical protein
MKTTAKYWEGQFEDVMCDGPKGQFRQRLEWFLFKLHFAVHAVETQSDGTQLLIFGDGSVYGGNQNSMHFSPWRLAGDLRQSTSRQEFRVQITKSTDAAERDNDRASSAARLIPRTRKCP